MAGPAERTQVGIIICTAMSLGYNVVDRCGLDRAAFITAVLTEVLVSLEYASAPDIPRATVAAFLPALATPIRCPTVTGVFLLVLLAVAAAVISDGATTTVPAGPFSSCRHRYLSAR